MPTKVMKRSPGKPAMIWLADMPTKTEPTRKARAKATAPMLIGNAVATTNMTTRPRMATSCGDIVHGLPGYGEQLAIVPLDLIGIPPVRACKPQADLASEQRLYACSCGTAVGFRALASSLGRRQLRRPPKGR